MIGDRTMIFIGSRDIRMGWNNKGLLVSPLIESGIISEQDGDAITAIISTSSVALSFRAKIHQAHAGDYHSAAE